MATAYSVPIERFLKRIKKDRKFFNYLQLSDDETLQIINERCVELLDLAVDRIIYDGDPQVDFTNRDDATEEFGFDLSPQEKLLIPSLMYEYYLQEDIAYLKCLNVNYTSSDLTVFDPSNARRTFESLYNNIRVQNEELLDTYKNTNRATNKLILVDFDSFDIDT